MKTHSRLLFASTFAIFAGAAGAAVPAVDATGVAAQANCGTNPATGAPFPLRHYDKIVFITNGPLQAAIQSDQPALSSTIIPGRDYDIKVRDNPATVADLKGKVLSFLGAADTPTNRDAVRIADVEYAAVCFR